MAGSRHGAQVKTDLPLYITLVVIINAEVCKEEISDHIRRSLGDVEIGPPLGLFEPVCSVIRHHLFRPKPEQSPGTL